MEPDGKRVERAVMKLLRKCQLESMSMKQLRLVRGRSAADAPRHRCFELGSLSVSQALEDHYGCSFAHRKGEVKEYVLRAMKVLDGEGTAEGMASPGVSSTGETPQVSPRRKRPRSPMRDSPKAAMDSPQENHTPSLPSHTASPQLAAAAQSGSSSATQASAIDSHAAKLAASAVVQYSNPTQSSSHKTSSSDGPPASGEVRKAGSSGNVASQRSRVPASELPLVMPRGGGRTGRTTVLVQADGAGDAFDVSGDVGAVGRLTSSKSGLILDLQGHRYAGTIVPCATHLVVGIGKSEAKVESIVNDFVQLEHLESVIGAMGGALQGGEGEGSTIAQLLSFADVDEASHVQDAVADADGGGAGHKAKKPRMIGTTRQVKRGRGRPRKRK